MRYKKIMILTIILTCLLAVSAVSAVENAADDIVSTNVASADGINVDANNQIIEQTGKGEIINVADNGTFTALQNKINNVESDSTITLENDYVYDDGFDMEGISISKSLTINGNGHSIDALKKSRIFKIIAGNIVLTNLTLKNGYSNCGGAVYVSGGYSNYVFDCNFVDNNADYGGAIYFNTASNGDKFIGTFVNNSAKDGGAITFHSGLNEGIFNASFYNNVAKKSGGAISISGDALNNIFDGYFVNNSANNAGGAFYLPLLSGSVKNTKFIGVFVNNSAGDIGGAFYIPSGYYNEFAGCYIGNSANNGGAIGIYSAVRSNKICGIFDMNNAKCGGAVYIACPRYEGNVIDKAIFRNNSAGSGSALYLRDDIEKTIVIKNSIFINNNGTIIFSGVSANSQIDCCWFGNTADNYDIAPNVNENVHINNWLFLNATSNPTKILSNHNSTITFSLSNLYDTYYKEIKNAKSELPKINLDISYKNGNVNKESVLLDEHITYTLISNSEGSIMAYYNGINYSITIKSLDNVSLIALNVSSDYGQNKRFNITLTENNLPLVNETITIKVNNQCYIVFTGDNGQTSIDLDVGVGNYTIVCEYYGLVVYSNYTVNKADSSLVIGDVNGTVGHDFTISVNITNSNSLTINEGSVVFFDGETNIGESLVSKGVATLTYAPTTAGEHNITAIFSSGNYSSSNNTAKLLVDSATVDVLVNQGIVGYNSTFVVEVKGLFSTINEGTVTFYINDEYLGNVPVAYGLASISYVPLNANNYTVKAVFGDSDKFLSDEDSASYVVVPADSEIIINDINGTVGYNITISVNLVSSNNLTINEGHVIFFVGSTQISESDVSDGIASLTYTPATAGEHTITAMFYSANYGDPINSALLNVSKAEVSLTIGNIETVYFTNPSNFAVNVLSNSKEVNEGNIKYYVDGNYNGMSYVHDGQSSLSFTTNVTGSFDLFVVYDETDNYLAKNASATFYVDKIPTEIIASGFTTVYNGGKYIVATLKDSNGNSLNDVKVTVKIGNVKTLTPTTDKNGQVKVSTNGLAPVKTYSTTITFAGNSKYDKSTKSVKVTVKKATPKLSAPSKAYKVKAAKKYIVTLKTNQNKVMKNTWVTLNVNKKTYKVKTNAKGQAVFKITNLKKKGNFKAVVKFAGDKYYNAKTVNTKIVVK